MERRDFISKLGVGAAVALTFGCFHAYSQESNFTNSNRLTDDNPEDFNVDLSEPSNASLLTNGGFIVVNDIVVARTKEGGYAAATVICSHKYNKKIRYVMKDNEWQCSAHGARFDVGGQGLNKQGSRGLLVYNTELVDENTLRVFSKTE